MPFPDFPDDEHTDPNDEHTDSDDNLGNPNPDRYTADNPNLINLDFHANHDDSVKTKKNDGPFMLIAGILGGIIVTIVAMFMFFGMRSKKSKD